MKCVDLLKSFIVFVDKVLALQGNAAQLNLNRFSLRCDLGYLEYLINGWILKVLERGVVDLDLYTSCEFNIHRFW